MTLAVNSPDPAEVRAFAHCGELRDRLRLDLPAGVSLDRLSMGMSGDFELAIEEGSTEVRIGTVGARSYPEPQPDPARARATGCRAAAENRNHAPKRAGIIAAQNSAAAPAAPARASISIPHEETPHALAREAPVGAAVPGRHCQRPILATQPIR